MYDSYYEYGSISTGENIDLKISTLDRTNNIVYNSGVATGNFKLSIF